MRELEQAVNDAADGQSSQVVVDLRDVGFMGGAAIGALLAGNANQAPQRHFAVVVNGNQAVNRPLELAGTGDVVELHEELGTALRCCRTSNELPRGVPAYRSAGRAHRGP